MGALLRRLLLLGWALVASAAPAHAQDFPPLSGRVVDAAELLSPAEEAELTAKLQALEQRSTRQLVVATVPDLGGLEIEDYGVRLGRAWGIGQAGADNGAILIVAPNQRRVRVEVGLGLEPILTDAFSNRVTDEIIVPRFRAGDFPGGIRAGTDALIAQLAAPPEVAERAALEAAQAQSRERQGGASSGGGVGLLPLIFWGMVILFVFLSFARRAGGRRYRGKRRRGRGGVDPLVVLWGLDLLSHAARGASSGGGGWGGGGGGGFGGFSGGGGGFGGGGASGSW